MIVKRVNLCALDTGSLTLGYVGENDHTQIRINCASVFADYPAAVVSMTVKAPSGVVYPREVETDGQVVIWTITDSDTASAGNGQIQLTFTEDGTIVKTVIAVTTVRASLVGDNPPPDPITDWIDEAGEALAKLEGLTASATELPAGEDPTAEVEVVDGHYNIALGIPGADAESIIDDTAGVGDTTKVWSANKSATDLSELKSDIDRKAPVILRDASGDIVSFADGADNMPLSSCVVSIDPVQSGTGDPSPTNVRPISGWTGAQISRTGKNLIPEFLNGGQTAYGLTITPNVDGSISITGTATNTSSTLISMRYVSITMPAGTYTFSNGITDANNKVYCQVVCNYGHVFFSRYTKDTYTYDEPFTITRLDIGINTANGETINVTIKPMLELGSTASTYTPYVGTTYPISWQTAAGTVYGGTVDLVTGKLVVTNALRVFDGSEGWSEYASYEGYWLSVSNMKKGVRQDGISNMLANSKSSDSGQKNAMWLGVNSSYLFVIGVYESMGNTLEGFKSYLSTHNLEVVYPLEHDIEYTLTPAEIQTLMGYNALWADTGAIAVTYPADTQTYVDGAIAAATDPDGNVVTVTGSTPSITGESGKRYVCGTVDSISITPPQTGIIDVFFTSGTTPTVLTVPNTVRFPAWFDSTSLDASTTYEINIQDGFGAVMAWT